MSSRSKQRRSPSARPGGALRSLGRLAGGVALAALAALAALLPGASVALADGVDPTIPRTVTVGAPRGAAPGERVDGQRTGRARGRLPFPPVEVWRRHVAGGIDWGPLVDADGNTLVALTVPEVLKLAPDGKELWRTRIGSAAPLAPPVLTSDGTLVLVTSSGQAWGLTPSGAVRFSTPLGLRGRDADTGPVALRDGGLVVVAGRALVEVDADGAVRARTSLDERAVGALLAGPEGTLVTTESGAVYSWRPPGAPRRLGSLGGVPRRGGALADARTLLAVVDNRRLVSLDLLGGATHVRSSGAPGTLLDGPPALTAAGLAVIATETGLLVGVDAAGNEKIHVVIEKPPPLPIVPLGLPGPFAQAPAPGFSGAVEVRPSPGVVVDPAGRVGFARAGGRAGVVSPEGNVAVISERLCAAPVSVTPAGEGRMLIACRDGALWMYGE